MANEGRGRVINLIQHNYVAVSIVLVIFLLFIPIPKILIDLCMILNLAFAVIIMLAVLSTARASDFQTFPRIILVQTMFGLGINIASTRLILSAKTVSTGISTEQSAMVQAFANIVAGNNIVIGFVIFIILIVVQVLVVTKGAGRVSEVQARFSLDSMSQKFFDVDNRLNSGMIDDEEAKRLKDAIRKEIDFYSNMDGSSKFVSGNVKAGIFITVVNLIGGFIVGMRFNGMNFSDALKTYSILTIGDGLMSQLPSIIISFATGLLVTGTKSDEDLGSQIREDFTRDGYTYIIVGVILIVTGIALRAGTQFLLVPIGGVFIFIGYRLSRKQNKEKEKIRQAEEQQKATNQSSASDPEKDKIALIDNLSLELGYALIPLVSKEKGAELLERITRIRNEAKLDMGFLIPKIHIQDNMTLDPNDYSFKIKGIEAGHANIRLGYYMCMDTGSVITPLKGEKTKDPAFGMDAIWLPEDQRQEAEEAGYVVVDPPTIIATHITELIRANAARMLGRQEVSSIIETVKEKNPVLVTEVLETAKLSYGQIQKVLQNLLEENVSIRDIVTILETLANYAAISKNPWDLTEKVREALGLQICLQYADNDKKLRVMQLSEDLAVLIQNNGQYPADGSKPMAALDPVDRRKWLDSVSTALARVKSKGYQPIILCPQVVRQLVHCSIEREMPGVVVLSEMEIMAAGRNVSVEVIDKIEDITKNDDMKEVI
ncbi:MAG: FHIPEP family type III secretion protein [Treponema sp.]|nr:FHIPEP family type III secretion protein [Treponema sp.]